jgi:hypothetical protein
VQFHRSSKKPAEVAKVPFMCFSEECFREIRVFTNTGEA